jgi:putative lipoic acid-binding regulatory protein
MKRFSDDSRANIEYPGSWRYTVIGTDRPSIEAAIAEVIEARSHKISLSNMSSRGKYVSLTLELIVLNEGERLELFEALKVQPAIAFVL